MCIKDFSRRIWGYKYILLHTGCPCYIHVNFAVCGLIVRHDEHIELALAAVLAVRAIDAMVFESSCDSDVTSNLRP